MLFVSKKTLELHELIFISEYKPENMTRNQLLELARARARAQFNESHRNSLVAEMMQTRPEVSERLEPVFFVFDESIKDCAVCTKEVSH